MPPPFWLWPFLIKLSFFGTFIAFSLSKKGRPKIFRRAWLGDIKFLTHKLLFTAHPSLYHTHTHTNPQSAQTSSKSYSLFHLYNFSLFIHFYFLHLSFSPFITIILFYFTFNPKLTAHAISQTFTVKFNFYRISPNQ